MSTASALNASIFAAAEAIAIEREAARRAFCFFLIPLDRSGI
jgi:hypothetical protein